MTEIERLINDALRDVALEIRSVEAIDLASDIHRLAFANIGDLVYSALELYFRPEALIFAYNGDVSMTWMSSPSVSLDLELHAAGVDAFFRLIIEGLSTRVALQNVLVDGAPWPSDGDLRCINRAIEAARLPRRINLHQPQTSLRP
jgi:hypothetical protein